MNILIVDDEQLSIDALTGIIRKLFPKSGLYSVLSPAKALAFLMENPIDVVLLDIEMCGMNGMELATLIKTLRPQSNIIFVTGYAQYALDAHAIHASGYLLKPVAKEDVAKEFANLRYPIKEDPPRIRIQCFGNFEIFIDGAPVVFKRAKAKELLAYLVDRQGASSSAAELTAVLWEDKEYTRSQRSYFQTVVSDMLATLKRHGAEHIVIKTHNSIAVDPTRFDCDFYRFLKGDINAVGAFLGEYMSNYSWAEMTAELFTKKKE